MVEASSETSNSAFAAALIIAIDWQGVPFYSWPLVQWAHDHKQRPKLQPRSSQNDEELAEGAATFTPVSEFTIGDSKWKKGLGARLKAKYSGAVRRRDTGDVSAVEDFEAICDAMYQCPCAVRLLTFFANGEYELETPMYKERD